MSSAGTSAYNAIIAWHRFLPVGEAVNHLKMRSWLIDDELVCCIVFVTYQGVRPERRS